MPRKINDYWYVSAGELADYIFCPEHWRLKRVVKVSYKKNTKVKEGLLEHANWFRKVVEQFSIRKFMVIVITLLAVSLALYFLLFVRR